MMDAKDVDPKIRRLFPWALFLVLAALFTFGAIRQARSEADIWACYGGQRYQAQSSAWPPCNEICGRVKAYVEAHGEDEARAEAKRQHLPQWLIRKAEKCVS